MSFILSKYIYYLFILILFINCVFSVEIFTSNVTAPDGNSTTDGPIVTTENIDDVPLVEARVAALEERVELFEPKIVRCSCTMSSCVSTNYMCKSLQGACFSKPDNTRQFSHTSDGSFRSSPILGCVESLPKSEQDWCLRIARNKKRGNQLHESEAEYIDGFQGKLTGGVSAEMMVSSYDEHTEFNPPSQFESYPDLDCCAHDVCNFVESSLVYVPDVRKIKIVTDDENRIDNNKVQNVQWLWAVILIVLLLTFAFITLMLYMTGKMLTKETKRQRMSQMNDQYYKGHVFYQPALQSSPCHGTQYYFHQVSEKTPPPISIVTNKPIRVKELQETSTSHFGNISYFGSSSQCSCSLGTIEERRQLSHTEVELEKLPSQQTQFSKIKENFKPTESEYLT